MGVKDNLGHIPHIQHPAIVLLMEVPAPNPFWGTNVVSFWCLLIGKPKLCDLHRELLFRRYTHTKTLGSTKQTVTFRTLIP